MERGNGISTNIGHGILQYLEERCFSEDGTGLENSVKNEDNGGCSPNITG